jgi:gluconate 2-dehydrogenase gamma chain
MADNEGVRRRDVLKGIGLTGAAAGLATTNVAPVANEAQAQPVTQSHAHAPAPARNDNPADAFRFFTAPEAAVVLALVDTLIPTDDVGPGGVEVGVPTFIDREMASAYGRGARMYLDGPFGEGTPQQGYQLPLAPAELYRVGIADLNAWCVKTRGGKTFDQLSAADRTAAPTTNCRTDPRREFITLLGSAVAGRRGRAPHVEHAACLPPTPDGPVQVGLPRAQPATGRAAKSLGQT